MHTACVWSEKLPFAGYSVVKDHSGGKYRPAEFFRRPRGAFPRTPFARSLAGPQCPAPFARVNLLKISVALQRPWRAWGCRAPGEPASAQCARFNRSGEYRARTGDLLVANQALSQLS